MVQEKAGRSSADHSKKVEINGQFVPDKIAGDFADSSKTKKPFSYFTAGLAPDLSDTPNPSSAKQANAGLIVNARPRTPKCLPVVSKQDLLLADHSNTMPITHTQYNDPIGLYSGGNVSEALHHAVGTPTPGQNIGGPANVASSKVYESVVHDKDPLPPAHSAQLEENNPMRDLYPQYRGFVDPKVQSPSFRRLQYITGETDEEDNRAHIRGGGQVQSNASVGPSAQVYNPGAQQTTQSSQFSQSTKWGTVAPPSNQSSVHFHHETHHQQQAAPLSSSQPFESVEQGELDPKFAAQIAAAERPRVPASGEPDWASKAQQKHRRWETITDTSESESRKASGPTPNWRTQAENTSDKWSKHYDHYHFEGGQTGQGQRRAQSQEPERAAMRTTQVKVQEAPNDRREWMKPYIAPNLMRSGSGDRSTVRSTSQFGKRNVEFGVDYGHLSQGQQKPSQHPQYPRYQSSQSQDFSKQSSNLKELNISTLLTSADNASHRSAFQSSPASWQRQAESKSQRWQQQEIVSPGTAKGYTSSGSGSGAKPTWTNKADSIGSKWQHEAEAYKRQGEMEQELARRQGITTYTTQSAVPAWRQGDPSNTNTSVVTYSGGTGPIAPQWHDAKGAATKSVASGDYLDPEGHKVAYTRETYTTSDPGKEYQMLTEEERKVMEQPLEPGVISRHVSTKYYKKSTYTSSTTSGTTQTPPMQSTLPHFNARLAVEAPRAGAVSPGVTEF